MRILAIDPGKSGGLCIKWADSLVGWNFLYKMPMRDNRVDVGKLQELIIDNNPDIAILEKQQNRNGQSGQSSIMVNYGRLTAVLDLCEVPYVEIEPRDWQKALGLTGDKQSHIDYAIQAGYDVPTKEPRGKVLSDGIADACCIAEAWLLTQDKETT